MIPTHYLLESFGFLILKPFLIEFLFMSISIRVSYMTLAINLAMVYDVIVHVLLHSMRFHITNIILSKLTLEIMSPTVIILLF
jgi:hypothetical protein